MSLLLLILSVHFLADFHLWPGSPDVKKHPCFRCLLPHFGMYSLILGLIFILCVSFPSAVIAWMFIILSHFITDVLTFHYYTRNHISPRSQLTAGRYVISGIIVECKNVGYKVRQDNEHPRDDCTGK